MEKKIAEDITDFFLDEKNIPKLRESIVMCHAVKKMLHDNSEFFENLPEKCDFKGYNCGTITENILDEMFNLPIENWGYIISTYALICRFTVACKILGMECFIEDMVEILGSYLERDSIQTFINSNGGWKGFCYRFNLEDASDETRGAFLETVDKILDYIKLCFREIYRL